MLLSETKPKPQWPVYVIKENEGHHSVQNWAVKRRDRPNWWWHGLNWCYIICFYWLALAWVLKKPFALSPLLTVCFYASAGVRSCRFTLYHVVNVFIAILKLCPKMKYCPYKHAHVSKRTKISPAFVFCFSSEINPNERKKVAFLLKPSHLMAHRVK